MRLAHRIASAFTLSLVMGLVFLPDEVLAIAPPTSHTSMTLAALLAKTATENPDVVSARRQWEAMRTRASYAGSLEAPRLNLSVMDLPSLGGPSLTLSQMLPSSGKRRLLSETAVQEEEGARAEYESRVLSVTSELKQAYHELTYLHRALSLHHLIRDQLKKIQVIATTKYAVGSAPQLDPIRAQLEISKLLNSELALEQRKRAAQAKINSLANRPLDAPITVPPDLPVPVSLPEEANLLAQAEAQSPAFRMLRAQVSAAEAQRSIAQQEKSIPDLDVGVQIGRSMPGDMNYIGGMLGMGLPWLSQDRLNRRLTESEQALAASQARYQARINELRYRARDLYSQLIRAKGQADLYRKGLIPQATQALNAALAAYQVNKVDFPTVIDSQKMVLETQMDYAMVLADYHKTLARLEAEIGVPTVELK